MTEPHPLMTPATTPPESPAVTPLPASETRQVHRCEAVKRDGSTCSYYVATILTPDGWRCYHHRPKPSADPAVTAQPAPRPPKGGKIEDPEDAQRLAAWAAQQVSLGQLPHQRGNSIANLCREFRRAFQESGELTKWVEQASLLLKAVEAYRNGDAMAAERWAGLARTGWRGQQPLDAADLWDEDKDR